MIAGVAGVSDLPIWANAILLVVSGALIWGAGTRLEHRVDQIADRTGMGRAFAGVLLLAGATSLPEVATTLSALLIHDNATLAVHNLLGGVALQTALLVIADVTTRKRGALTSFRPRFVLLLQGVGLVMMLQLAIVGATSRGTPTIGWVSIWSILLLVVQVGMMYMTYRKRGQPRWTPTRDDDYPVDAPPDEHVDDEEPAAPTTPMRTVWLRFAGAAAIVLVAGWAASGAADALAHQTGLGSAFLGATLLALVTSMPEVSTTISASRGGRYTTAISNIFGSNTFDVALVCVADLLFLDGAIMAHASSSVVFVAAIAAAMTCIYLWGLLERSDRSVARVGWDSVLALGTYVTGVFVLYVVW